MTRDELVDALAAVEHQRWADWQKYLHSRCGTDPTHSGQGALLIMPEDVKRWERQILTPYASLSEAERQSDREQVDRYWTLIVAFVAEWIEGWCGNTCSPEAYCLLDDWREEMGA